MTDKRIKSYLEDRLEKLENIKKEREWTTLELGDIACCKQTLAFIDSLQEEPKECMYSKDNYTDEDRKVLCDGCEEECKYARKEEPVSESLEEASKNHAYSCHTSKATGERIAACIYDFKAGAKWQEEQMMAKTVDGDITFDYYGDDDKTYGCIAHNSFCLEDFGLKDRDKVKMILIKED